MHKSSRVIAIVIALLASLIVVAGPPAAASEPDEMGTTRAGKYYLKGSCRLAPAANKFNKQIWRGRKYIYRAEVQRRLPEIRRLSTAYGNAHQRFVRHLYNPPAQWPSEVQRDVNKLAAVHLRYSEIRRAQGRAGSAQRWLNLNGRANRMPYGPWASRIRARLDLPPPGEGC